MKIIHLFAIATSILSLPACERRDTSPREEVKDKVNDALDNRPGEKVRDAVEDTGDAIKDAAKE